MENYLLYNYVIMAICTSVPCLLVVADPTVIMRHSDVKAILYSIRGKLCGKCGEQQKGISAVTSLI